jgi:hypothetical protein
MQPLDTDQSQLQPELMPSTLTSQREIIALLLQQLSNPLVGSRYYRYLREENPWLWELDQMDTKSLPLPPKTENSTDGQSSND